MDAAQREFLDDQFTVREWHGRGGGQQIVREFGIEDLEFENWRLARVKREDRAGVTVLKSMWRRGDSEEELLSLDVYECPSLNAAHDQLLEMLANIQSPKVERVVGNPPGDVAFGLANTMILFARANVAVWIRNAGPRVVPVGGFARRVDAEILRKLEGR